MTLEMRTERHVIKQTDPYFDLIHSFCKQSKRLYNHANYLIRQAFLFQNKWLRYPILDKLLKADIEFPDYKNMPTAQSAQQLLKLLDNTWKGCFAAIKDYKKHSEKYTGRPKLPKYLKTEAFVLILTNQNCKLKGGILHFPKVFRQFTIKPLFLTREGFHSFRQVRFLPERDQLVMELVYDIEICETIPYNGHSIGIDLGVNNLAACADNQGSKPFLINGRPLKAINQYYNKEKARYQSVLEKMNGKKRSKRLEGMTKKRNRKIKDYLHKASRYLIDYCKEQGITQIIIGKNKGWKTGSDLGKRVNQNFVGIPFGQFIEMVLYKAKEEGITVILTEESYTSGTSFLDNEEPVKGNYDKSRRICRGLFKALDGTRMNADVNGAYQIMKKVVPVSRDRGCVLHPSVVSL